MTYLDCSGRFRLCAPGKCLTLPTQPQALQKGLPDSWCWVQDLLETERRKGGSPCCSSLPPSALCWGPTRGALAR